MNVETLRPYFEMPRRHVAPWVLSSLIAIAMLCSDFPLAAETKFPPFSIEWQNAAGNDIEEGRGHLVFTSSPFPELPPSRDPARFRIIVRGVPVHPTVRMTLMSLDPNTKKIRDRLDIPLGKETDIPGARTSPWLVLVTDLNERFAPRRRNRALLARPRDEITASLRQGGGRPMRHTMPVGFPDATSSPRQIFRLKLRTTVLKNSTNGKPLIGEKDYDTRRIVEHQMNVLRDVLAQCAIEVVAPLDDIQITRPPKSCMIAIGDKYGLPSRGGEVRMSFDGVLHGPWTIAPQKTPKETAEILARKIESIGYLPSISVNTKLPSFALQSADIVVRNAAGRLAELGPWPNRPVYTDRQQSMQIGSVDTSFGIDSYDQNNFRSGTLEERTLVKCLTRPSDNAIDVFIVDGFRDPSKQGETFIRDSDASMANTVLIDVRALFGARQSYTLSHEVGHVLLNDLDHPDARGQNRPYLLMHSRSSSAVGGPKRLSEKECKKMREVSKDLLF